jgi:Flp pilus assembly protein TadG
MKGFRFFNGPPGEKGSITPVVALGLVAFVGAMALSIDLGQLFLVKNEVQNVADAAALAGAKKLLQDKNPVDGVPEVYCDEAIQAAIDVANQNFSFGSSTPITLTAADVTIGKWDLATKQFTRTGCSANPMEVNAVQVTVNRAGGDNAQVSTFFGSVLGVGTYDPSDLEHAGPTKLSVAASSVAMLGLAGTSAIDLPFAIPYYYAAGGGVASNGFQRVLDKFTPAPAYASDPQTYRWKDLGGYNPVATNRATFVVPTHGEQSNTYLVKYLKGPYISGGKQFPQKAVGDQLWPMSEWYWGSYIKPTMQALKDRFNNANTPKINGKWRITVPVFKTTPVTSALPQNSWFQLASRLLPGVSQAYACTAYSPAVYTQGFATIDVTNVYVKTDCITTSGSTQVNNSNSCRNTCYMDIEVPLNQNTLSTDKGSNPIPYQKDYKDMNSAANEVGVFAAVPRIVK